MPHFAAYHRTRKSITSAKLGRYANLTGRSHNPEVRGLPDDHDEVWQYNLYLDPDNSFQQLGTPGNPVVYWLVVDAVTESLEGQPEFGWKTSLDHWNDDAVYADSALHDASGDQWQELHHPDTALNMSLDMAFVIVPEPATLGLLILGGLALFGRRS